MSLNIGIRAHDIDNLPLEELVSVIASKGLTAVQLALGKSFREMNTSLGSLSPGFAHHIGSVFKQKGIQIAILGCYINMIHPDCHVRRKELERFKEHIRFARDFGCSIVGTETGNVNPDIVYTEENFKEQPFYEVVESVKELVEEAEKFGVIVGIEGGINHPIHTPQRMKRLLEEIPSNHLQVIYDPANFISMDNYEHQEEVIQEAIELFGDKIVALHAKDFIIENNWVKIVPVGQGLLNYEVIFKSIKQKKPFLNVLMEGTREPYIDGSMKYLKEKYSNIK
ncbi:sugar phosphate isomerase/epimerase family protein [Ureibacillus sp. 179-F W5.1 NHS]|uniref:Sugar phosphate isomerase/epimerase n=1 Tax=Lysinibacillus halotolerans TaxID=1368476 RepID=A0A3M8HC56_9BACI|nr:sugar phosphate isomerase/epimerase family protein [Lysinibacillus halotolerans]RNC99898.1 sugar phosphate isomerase/epimerase [Lysinibacillus halotolerans]